MSMASSQPRPYNLRKAARPSTRLTGQDWKTAHKRRRALAESSANTRRRKVMTQPDELTPGRNMLPISNFLEAMRFLSTMNRKSTVSKLPINLNRPGMDYVYENLCVPDRASVHNTQESTRKPEGELKLLKPLCSENLNSYSGRPCSNNTWALVFSLSPRCFSHPSDRRTTAACRVVLTHLYQGGQC